MGNKITFLPDKAEYDISSDKSVMELAFEKGIPIQSSCKGMATCGECRVIVVEGENQVLPPTSQEISLIGQGHYIDQRRLSCQLYCFGNITVDVSEQKEKSADPSLSKTFLKRIKKEKTSDIHSIKDNLIEQNNERIKKTCEKAVIFKRPEEV